VVQPAVEAVIFFLRAFLKADFNLRSVARSMRGRSIFPRQVLDEFSALRELGPADEIVDVCRHHFPELEKVIPAFFSRRGWDSDSLFTLYSIQRIVLSVLKPYRLFLGSDLKAESASRRLAARSPRVWLQGGGLTIAFVGADGSGKSSTVGEMAKWIGWKLRVRPIYMGLPKTRTRITRWKRLSHVARRFGLRRLQEILLERYCLAVASVRQENAALAARINGQGGIVLFDRFPLTDFWGMEEPMDGPRLNSSSRWHQHERRIYKQLEQPDHIFVLSTTDAMSIERKPELGSPPRRDALQQKIDAVDRFAAAAGGGVTVIDTSQGRDACLLEIKRVVWSLL
jgi:thymidylate kinase